MKKNLLIFLLIINSYLYADYNDMPIQDFVNIVATQNNINIVTDKKIEKNFSFYINKKINGKVNINVLTDLLDQNGFILQKEDDNYYIIKSKEDLLINKIDIFEIKYANTQDIKIQIEQILNSYYKSYKIVKTNKNDKKFTPMDERKPGDSDTNLNIEETEEKINYSVHAINNKSIAVTYKDKFVPIIAKEIIDALDYPPKRIMVKVKIYEVQTDALKEFSSAFEVSGKIGNTQIDLGFDSKDGMIGIKSYTGSENTVKLNTLITALEKSGDAKITAEPSIFLYEGKSSKLIDGKSYPVSSQDTVVNNNATTSTSSYNNQDTGMTFDLTFDEYRSGLIYLKLNLDISLVDNYDADEKQIITKKRNLTEDLLITPGTQINLGGLTTVTDSKITGGIPFLKDIPWLGFLFEFEKEVHEESMLIIQLTANIVPYPKDKKKIIWNDIKKRKAKNE